MAEDLEQLLAEGSEIAVIGYHLADDYSNVYSDARGEYYNMLALPHVVVDGTQSFEWNYDDLLEKYEERIGIPSNYSISFNVERNGTEVNTTVNVGQIGAPNPETKVLHLVLTESHIPESWYGGEEVNHVERLMIPDQNGTPIYDGNSILNSFDFEFEMDPSWLLQNCELVAFLQDTVTKEVMQSQVFLLESTVLYNDVALTDIINPGDDYCMESISPIIKIENFAADTLTSCVIAYSINGDEYEYNWEGNLTTYQSEDVTLPEVTFVLEDNNSIEVELSLPNGQEDENPDNNLIENSFSLSQIIGNQNLILELKTDYLGSETSWELLNSLGEIVYSGDEYEDTTLYIIDMVVDMEDCYTFIIYDAGGNGICCENGFGYYRIKDIDELIYFVGGNFENQDVSTFQIDIETNIPNIKSANKVSFSPNPVIDEVSIRATSLINKVIILDTKGAILMQNSFVGSENIKLTIDHLLKGIYIIRVETKDGWCNLKMIKN